MKKTMMFRNAMCIVVLFSIMVLFFCFGAVANAAENGETETFTYSLSYEVPSNYTSNFIGNQIWDYESFSLNYRLVILHHSDADVDVITSPDPDKVVVVSKNYNFYRLGNDGSLTSISSTGVSVSYTLRRVRRSNNEAETVNGTRGLQSFYASSVSTDIPIYEADEAGKASALEYLKTGNDSGSINRPDWSEGSKDNSFGLNTFSGSLDGSNLITSWNGVSSRVVDISNYKNTGVRSVFTFKTADGLEDIEGKVYKISDNGFSIDVSSLSDGSFYSVTLTPFYYSGDDVVSGKLRLGVDSIFYNPDAVSGYDGDLFNIKNCQYATVPPLSCHGDVLTSGCFKLTWTPEGTYDEKIHDTFEVKLYAKVSVAFDTDVKRNYYTFCFPTGYKDIKTILGQYSFCSADISDFLISNGYIKSKILFNDNHGAFQINEVYKLYVRTVREDVSSGSKKYGNWSVYDFNSKKWYQNNQQDITDGRVVIGDTDPDPDNGDISGGDGGKITLPEKPGGDSGLKIGDLDFSDIGSIGKFFISLVNSLIQVIGSFPSLFASVFLFLPSELISMIYLGIVLVIIIGLIKAFL